MQVEVLSNPDNVSLAVVDFEAFFWGSLKVQGLWVGPWDI